MSSLTRKSVKFKTKMFWQDNYAISLFVLQFVSNKENSVFLYKSWHKRGKKNPSKRCETNKLITNYHNDVLREKNLYIFNEWGAQKAKKAADTWAAVSGVRSNNNLGGQTVKKETQKNDNCGKCLWFAKNWVGNCLPCPPTSYTPGLRKRGLLTRKATLSCH